MDLDDAVARGNARQVLRDAYTADVEALAVEFTARVRRGEFDTNYPWFEEILEGAIRKHPRVTDSTRAFETIAYSQNRNAIEVEVIEGWSVEEGGPWAKFQGPIDPDSEEFFGITLPAWPAIAYHAFRRDLNERIDAILGATPERYIATRLGHDRT